MAGQQIRADIALSSSHTLRDTRTRRYHGAVNAAGCAIVVASTRGAGSIVELRAVSDGRAVAGWLTIEQARAIANALHIAAATIGGAA